MDFVKLEVEATTAIITIDRPKALNALNPQVLSELADAVAQIRTNAAVRAVIITGAGEKAFVAGADIAAMANFNAEEAKAFGELGHRVMDAIEALPVPVIAAVNGFALGGGSELALACDFIYASEKAKFGLPEVSLGVIPGFGGTQRLTRLLGRARAKEIIFTGDMIDAAKAKAIGLALEVVAPEELLPFCKKVAATIAKRGPLAITQAKTAIDKGGDLPLEAGNALERNAFSILFGSADQKEGMAAFLAKRPPEFKGA
jgi:enoyl-CoA hydratase